MTRTGRIVIIMQRLHEDDLVGHVSALDNWEVLRLPALAEQDEEYELQSFHGRSRVTRLAGEPLHAAREPQSVLNNIRASVGEYNFACQYLEAPIPLGGGMVKREWFRSYGPGDLPERFDQTVLSWDTANKPSELNDFSVCTTWGIISGRIYLLHVLRKRMEYPDLKRAVRAQAELHQVRSSLSRTEPQALSSSKRESLRAYMLLHVTFRRVTSRCVCMLRRLP